MKNIVAVILSLFLSGLVFGQSLSSSEIPQVVLTQFQRDYPKAYDIKWKLDGTNYKVKFEIGWVGKDHKVWYDKSGKVVRIKEELSASDLPSSILAKINEKYPPTQGYRLDDIDKVTEGKEVVYIVEVKGASKWKSVFDEKGVFLSQIRD